MVRKLWPFAGLILVVIAIAAGAYLAVVPAPQAQSVAPDAQGSIQHAVESGTIAPDASSVQATRAPDLSASEMEALLQRKLALRAPAADQVDSAPAGPPGLPDVVGRESEVAEAAESQFHGTPGLFVFGRNNLNTNANNATLASTLAEPAAANNGVLAFAAGNFRHAEFSSNGGVTWTNVPLPGGPADAPILCCDHDVVIDDARRVVFHTTLYINSLLSNGVVRIFVRRTINTTVADCSFTIDPAGLNNNILPDFPHIGVTKRFLFLTINAVGGGAPGTFARIYRFNIDQLSDCVTTSFTTFTQPGTTFGQRVWVPAGGTNNSDAMLWGQLDNTTTFRVFRWLDASVAPFSFPRAISASTFGNPDCRGGTGNFDWIDGVSAGIFGFNLHGAIAPGVLGGFGHVAFYWQVAADAQHTQGHIHAAVFDLHTLALLAQPHIFNNTFCFGKPKVTSSKRGDLGMVLGFGGRAGGGGTAARPAAGIDDQHTVGTGVFGTFFAYAAGTHNRSDARYGDYFTIHPHEPCEKWFVATGYALNGGTGVANVNSRYIEFGRNESARCYRAHRFQIPAP